MTGGDFFTGAGRGALREGVSYLNDVYTDWRIEQELFSPDYALAQQGDPIYNGGTLSEV